MRFLAVEELDAGKLFVGNSQYAYLTIFWHKRLDAANVYGSIFAAGTVAYIDGKLEHREAVAHYVLTEACGVSSLLFRSSREVEEYKYPHNSVFAEALHRED